MTDRNATKPVGIQHVSHGESGSLSLYARHFLQARLLPLVVVFMGFVAMSPVFPYLGWQGIYSLLIVLAFSSMFTLLVYPIAIKKWFLFLSLLVLATSMGAGLYWGDIRYLFANVFLLGALYLVQMLSIQALHKAVDFASIFLLFVLVGSVIGAFLVVGGVAPIFEFSGIDSRPIYVFYTTISGSHYGDFIRPAGIYDEPGALSLYVCCAAAIRHLLFKDNRLTWVLLLLGFVTLSLAHLVYVVLHFLSERFTRRNIYNALSMVSLFVVVIYISGFHETLNDRLFDRLLVAEGDKIIEGDNRSFRMGNAIDLIKKDPVVLFFGADPVCRFDYTKCREMFPPIGENPLSPLVRNGLFVSWPYYLSLLVLLVTPIFGRKYFVAFAIGLLLMQRPEMLGLSGSMVFVLVLLALAISLSQSEWIKGLFHVRVFRQV